MLTEAGYLADPLSLAQRLMEKLQVDLNADVSDVSEMYCLSLLTVLTSGRDRFHSPNNGFKMVLFLNTDCATDGKPLCLRVSLSVSTGLT